MRVEIPVVIIARNNLALTKKAVNSALAQDVPVEVLVVDNDSQDGTANWLRTKHLTTIFTGEQWSLAKCWNVALQALWKVGFDRALVLNNDVQVSPWACRVLNSHGGPFVTCVSVNNEEQFEMSTETHIETLKKAQRPHPDFSAFFIRKSVTDKIGWFDEECWPAYTEDAIAHLKMHRAGIQAVCIDVAFLHYGAGTLKQADPGEAARIRRGADANRQRFKRLYGCLPGSPEYYAMFGSTEPAPHSM